MRIATLCGWMEKDERIKCSMMPRVARAQGTLGRKDERAGVSHAWPSSPLTLSSGLFL